MFKSFRIYSILIAGFLPVKAQYNLVTSEPFATRDKEFTLTCNISLTETAAVIIWSRNGASVAYILISNCSAFDAGQGLYNLYRYNCTGTREQNLNIPTPRINSEGGSKWDCGPSAGGVMSNTYTLQFYTPPAGDPVITGYDGTPRFPGDNIVLTCTVNGGIPLSTLNWTCKGVPVQGTSLGISRHTVTIDTSYNEQRCICTASHPMWTMYKVIRSQEFVVHYKPSMKPVVSGFDGSVHYQGDVVTLTCQVSGGSPLANLSWTCDGQPQVLLSSTTSGTIVTSKLTLTMEARHNGKTCICHGRHPDSSYIPDISTKTFIVYYPPSIPSILPSNASAFPWIEGGNGTLTCISQPGNPSATTYQWTREDVIIQEETGTSLTLTSLTKNDNGKTYKCKVSNAYTVYKNEEFISRAKQLNVEYRPVMDIGITPAYVRETDNFVQLCKADGNPTPIVIWTPSIDLSNTATLKLVNIMRNHTGDYTCKAEAQSNGAHGLLSNQAVLKVIVQYPPRVEAVFSTHSIIDGKDVLVVCQAQGVPDNYTYSGWTQIYKQKIIRSNYDFSTVSQDKRNLTLYGVSYQDIGTYKCGANNGIPDKNGNEIQEGESDLVVKFSAVFNSSRKFYLEQNTKAEVIIPFLCNPPVLTANDITLTKNNINKKDRSNISVTVANRSLDINFHGKVVQVDGQEAAIKFNYFTSNLQGTYKIGIKNFPEGSISTFAFEIIPSGKPDHPKDFRILTSTTDTIIMTWLAGNNGGYRQTFVIVYQQTGKEETRKTQNVTEVAGKEVYIGSIDALMSDTEYNVWIYAYNSRGNTKQNIESINYVVSTKEMKYRENTLNSDNNGMFIGLVIGFIAGLLCEGIGLVILLWRKGFLKKIKCSSEHEHDTNDNDKQRYEDIKNSKEEANVYEGINQEGAENAQEFNSSQAEYVDLDNSPVSTVYKQLEIKGTEDIKMSSIYINTTMK